MKILYVTTISNTTNAFLIPHIKMLIDKGHKVDVAFNIEQEVKPEINDMGCKIHQLPLQRSPLKVDNLRAYRMLKDIIISEEYDLIHTHTPVASALVRLVCRNLNNVRVFYTAHGFHFYNGAPLKNWLLYYPIEKWLSKYTDCLITINEEDYNIAKNKFKAKDVRLVNGVGIDLNKFNPLSKEDKNKLKIEYGFGENDFILFYAGEMSYRKHQDFLIKVLDNIKYKISNIKLLLAGKGDRLAEYEEMVIKMGLEDKVIFLGFRKDIHKLLQISDIAVSSSRQEGLPVNVMEAMATGLPLVVSNCRGNRDLVKNDVNGYVIDLDDVDNFADSIYKIYSDEVLYNKFSKASLDLIEKYSLENVLKDMREMYIQHLMKGR